MNERAVSSGLVATPSVRIRRIRQLPVPGEIRVKTGDRVNAEAVVASASLPGKLHPVEASKRLGVSPVELQRVLRAKEGELVTKGQVLVESHGFFGMGRVQVLSPCDGTVVSVSPVTGQVVIAEAETRLDLRAYLPGTVVTADAAGTIEIESVVSLIQGVFGVGGERFGRLTLAATWPEDDADFRHICGPESILFSKEPLTYAAMQALKRNQVAAAVSGSVPGGELMRFAGRTLNPACTGPTYAGDEGIGLCLVVTEGFGLLPMADRTFELLSRISGEQVSVNGVTQVRAGVIRPEIIGPPQRDFPGDDASLSADGLAVGDRVRIVRGRRFGAFGRIRAMPADAQTVGSGAKSLVYEVEISTGERWIVPRANVEPAAGP